MSSNGVTINIYLVKQWVWTYHNKIQIKYHNKIQHWFCHLTLVFLIVSPKSFCLQFAGMKMHHCCKIDFLAKYLQSDLTMSSFMLKFGCVQSKTSQCYESSAWQVDSSRFSFSGFYSLWLGELIPANTTFEKCWNCIEAIVNIFYGKFNEMIYLFSKFCNWQPPLARWIKVPHCNVGIVGWLIHRAAHCQPLCNWS